MIVSCNACHKRYLIDEILITPEGRTVRCAACGNSWTQFPQVEDIKFPFSETEPLDNRNLRLRTFLKAILVVVLLGGIAASIYGARDSIVERWPAAGKILGEVQKDPAQGLVFDNILPLQTRDKGQSYLVLKGEIINTAREVRHLGPLNILIHGDCATLGFLKRTITRFFGKNLADRCVVDKWQHELTQKRLLPGEKLGFETIPHLLQTTASEVVIEF